MKKKYIVLLCLILAIFLTGCTGRSVENPERILNVIEEAVVITENAANNKDVKLARELWTKVSQYGIKAAESGNKELADSLGKLASTYEYLVIYIETGDELSLKKFRGCFEKASNELREYVNRQQVSTK